MTPKEKAKELYNKFNPHVLQRDFFGDDVEKTKSKICALIAVDEILNSSPSLPILGDGGTFGEDIELSKVYWQEVKNEIKAL